MPWLDLALELDHWANLARLTPARRAAQQRPKLSAECYKLPNFGVDFAKMAMSQFLHTTAGWLASASYLQELLYLCEGEAEGFGSTYKVQRGKSLFPIDPVAAGKPLGRWQDPLRLVVADRRGSNPDTAR